MSWGAGAREVRASDSAIAARLHLLEHDLLMTRLRAWSSEPEWLPYCWVTLGALALQLAQLWL